MTAAAPEYGELLVRAEGVTVRAGGRALVQAVDLAVARGEIVTVVGPNGSGKTTLVRTLLGVLRPTEGRIWRREGLHVGYVPQRLHVDATLPLTAERFLRVGQRADGAATRRALAEVGVEHLAGESLQSLSGGEFQRVVLARALLRDPDLLILDEPMQGVDVSGQLELYALIGRLRGEHDCGVVLVSHDLHLVMRETDRVLCLNGHVCCTGTPEAVVSDPAYMQLFGTRVAEELAVYHHDTRHDHHHAPQVPPDGPAGA